MAASLGLGIHAGGVRAVMLRGARIVWSGEEAGDPALIGELVARLLARVPLGRGPRPRVTVAVGPSLSQTKALSALPGTNDRALLTEAVRANPSRFFLGASGPTLVPAVERRGEAWWGATFSEWAVRAVADACLGARYPLVGFTPAVMLAAEAFGDGELTWTDGSALAAIVIREGAITRVRLAQAALPPAPVNNPVLASLGDGAAHFADAFGAAVRSRRSEFLLEARDPDAVRRARRVTRVALIIALVAGTVGFVAAPGIAAWRDRATVESRLESLQGRARWAASTGDALRRDLTTLDRVSRFAASRHSVSMLIGAFADALPESTAIVSLRVDSIAGSVTFLSTAGAGLLHAVARAPGVSDPRIVGSVTRENIEGAELQRANIGFRLRAPAASSSRLRAETSR